MTLKLYAYIITSVKELFAWIGLRFPKLGGVVMKSSKVLLLSGLLVLFLSPYAQADPRNTGNYYNGYQGNRHVVTTNYDCPEETHVYSHTYRTYRSPQYDHARGYRHHHPYREYHPPYGQGSYHGKGYTRSNPDGSYYEEWEYNYEAPRPYEAPRTVYQPPVVYSSPAPYPQPQYYQQGGSYGGNDPVTGTLLGGALGAAAGAAIGAVVGSPGDGAAIGAVVGGLSGASRSLFGRGLLW